MLLPAAVLARCGAVAGWGSALSVLVIWALPAGTPRASVLGAWLVIVMAWALVRGWRDAGVSGAVAVALGAQMLFQGGRLLTAGRPADWIALLLLPAVAGVALAVLSRRLGGVAWAAAGMVLLLGGGWSVGSTTAWMALALGVELSSVVRSRWAIAVGAVALVGGLALETRSTAVALLTGLVLAAARSAGGEGRWRLGAGRAGVALVALAVAGLAMASMFPLRSWATAIHWLAWIPLLVPAIVWAVVAGRVSRDPSAAGRWVVLAALAVLALSAALASPDLAGLCAPLGAMMLSLGTGRPSRLTAQFVWTGALVAAASVLASYPWLRSFAAADALSWWGLEAPPSTAAWLGAGLLGLAVTAVSWASSERRLPNPAGAAGVSAVLATAALWIGCVGLFPNQSVARVFADRALTAAQPRLQVVLEGEPRVAEVALWTHLSNGALLAEGHAVAAVRLLDASGEEVASWPLRAGLETGEWAVRRPDVAALPGLAAPDHWTVWVESGEAPSGSFFGQRYRAVFPSSSGDSAARLAIERSPDLPDDVAVTVHRFEVLR